MDRRLADGNSMLLQSKDTIKDTQGGSLSSPSCQQLFNTSTEIPVRDATSLVLPPGSGPYRSPRGIDPQSLADAWGSSIEIGALRLNSSRLYVERSRRADR